MIRSCVAKVASLSVMLLAANIGHAQKAADPVANYPARPVMMVVPYSPGGGADADGRIFSDALSKAFGQNFVMVFKPGGNMAVGMTYAANQRPDGYTLVLVASTYTTLPLIVKDASYDPVKSFELVSLLTRRSTALCVVPDFPAKNLKEYVAYAKAKPGALLFAAGGEGSGPHVQGLLLELATGTKVTYVHYKGVGASLPDVMGGRVHAVPLVLGAALPLVKSGKLRAIALSGRQRNAAVPDVPTAIEQGFNWEYYGYLGMAAPAKTPPAIVNKLQRELARIAKDPEMQKKFSEDTTVVASTPAEFQQYFASELARLRKLVATTGVELTGN